MALGPVSEKTRPNDFILSRKMKQQARQIIGKIIEVPKMTTDHTDILVVLNHFFKILVHAKCVLTMDYRLALEIFNHLNAST